MSDMDRIKDMEGGPVIPARRITPAERNGFGSDRKAAALGEIHQIRQGLAEWPRTSEVHRGLARLEAIVRSMP